jgi:tRNA 2-thiouridine synthesizing protein D
MMSAKPVLMFVLMDAPFESARTTTAFRLVHTALARGYGVNVFAYEGAVALSFARQAAHPNAVHGHDVTQEDHPLSRNWIAGLLQHARDCGVDITWVNCGLCVDERGVGETIEGVRRGSPADCWKMAQQASSTLVIPTK